MLLPRRRITSLTLLAIIGLTVWYLNLFPSLSREDNTGLPPITVKTKPANEKLVPPNDVGSISHTLPAVLSPPVEEVPPTEEDALAPVTDHEEILIDHKPPPASVPSPVSGVSSSVAGNTTSKPKHDAPVPKIKTQKGEFTFGLRTYHESYPVNNPRPLPVKGVQTLPSLQRKVESESPATRKKRIERLEAVKESFAHSWVSYKMHAWKQDELKPVAGGGQSSFGGWAATMVDALDTLWIMGMKSEFRDAIEAVKDIDFYTTDEETLNVFETTIRYLGGFLGAYDLTHGEEEFPILLEKAVEIADFIYCSFDTPNRMPNTRWAWKESLEGKPLKASTFALIAEMGSLTLEFTRLSQLTGDPKYYDAVTRIMEELFRAQNSTKLPGLWPIIMDAEHIKFEDNGFGLGGMADSTYEYLPKQHMLLGGADEMYQKMYKQVITAAQNHVFFRPMLPDGADVLVSGFTKVTDAGKIKSKPEGQHLGCFLGGMVGIGGKLFDHADHLPIARKLIDSCIWTYDHSPTGVGPETFMMLPCTPNSDCAWDEDAYVHEVVERAKDKNPIDLPDLESHSSETAKYTYILSQINLPKGFTDIPDRRYILRPEAIESIFIHWRLTGDADLPDKAWKMFTAIENATRTDLANSAIHDVLQVPPEKADRMESFWMAETLKYFYLMFSEPDVVSLDEYVFNTEAHPLRRPVAGVSGGRE